MDEIQSLFKERARAHILVYGKVHGVFFRDYTKKKADELKLTGWVKNIDRAVEIVAEGDKATLRTFIIECQKGSPLAKVEKTDYEWEEYTGKFDRFFINY